MTPTPDIVAEARRVADMLAHVYAIIPNEGPMQRDELSSDAARLLRTLAAIVERLPVTADGVPITLGMSLCSTRFHYGRGQWWLVVGILGPDTLRVQREPSGGTLDARPWKFASSREFAEAATGPWQDPATSAREGGGA